MIVALMHFDSFARWALNLPARPMRREDQDGELEIDSREDPDFGPLEDEREYGNPVGSAPLSPVTFEIGAPARRGFFCGGGL